MSSRKQLQTQRVRNSRAREASMAAIGNRGGGRRSKGERFFVGTRVPVAHQDQLKEAAARDNLSVSEFVENLIVSAVNDPKHGSGRKGPDRLSLTA